MARKYLFGSKQREDLWLREKHNAQLSGRGDLPICNLCDLPVRKTDAWDESHDPGRAKAFGGKRTAIAHRLCNHLHGAQVVTPAIAKSNKVRRRDIGAAGPGLGRHPMPGGRRSRLSKSFSHGVVPRLTLSEKLAVMRAKRAIGGDIPEFDAPPVALPDTGGAS
ncbi:MAG: hypothetical protein HXY30_17295 [Pseudorhodoplanes sp.]|nr:hypothetical protein [Pseudorhodoplanes sp.]